MFRESSKIFRTVQFPFSPPKSVLFYMHMEMTPWEQACHTTLTFQVSSSEHVFMKMMLLFFSILPEPPASYFAQPLIYCQCVCVLSHCHVPLFVIPWTVGCQALCPWGFSRQECWSGLSCLSTGDLHNAGIEPRSPTLQADSWPSEPAEKPIVNMEVLKSLSQSQHFSVKHWSETLSSRLNLIMWFTHTHLLSDPRFPYNRHWFLLFQPLGSFLFYNMPCPFTAQDSDSSYSFCLEQIYPPYHLADALRF